MIQVCHSKFQYHFSTFVCVEAIFGIDLKWMYERYVWKTILLCLIGHRILVIFLDKLSVICISDEQWQLRKSTYDLNWFRRLESCFSVNQYFLFLTRMFPSISGEIGMGFFHFAVQFSKTFNLRKDFIITPFFSVKRFTSQVFYLFRSFFQFYACVIQHLTSV